MKNNVNGETDEIDGIDVNDASDESQILNQNH